jgi:hypothetical protein
VEKFNNFRLEKRSFEFGRFTKVELSECSIWVEIEEVNSKVFFDECAHMGGNLDFQENFVCRHHGWTYFPDGSNVHKGSPGLRRVHVSFENSEYLEIVIPNKVLQIKSKPKKNLTIQVISHACLLIQYGTIKILFDPWIVGSTYYGSWHLYPQAKISKEDLDVDAIVITHPHPDHFHVETLSMLNHSIPIYFPKFPSGLIEKSLTEMGWKDIQAMPWDDSFRVGENFKVKFIRPRSNWEDSATLTMIEEVEGNVFSWLNLVDAGSVVDMHALPELDLLSSAFDQGASGYPLTWSNLSEKTKLNVLTEQKKQTLNLLPSRSKQLSAKYFLPFAGHWRLGLERHKQYAEVIPHTTFEEILDTFGKQAPDTQVLPIMPGFCFNFISNEISKYDEGSKPLMASHRKGIGTESEEHLDSQHLIKLFADRMGRLVAKSEAFGVENIEFIIQVEELSYSESFLFSSVQTAGEELNMITVKIPPHIFGLFAMGRANWDHIAIGYWGVWNRQLKSYPANFMRLLQAGELTPYTNQNFLNSKDEQALLDTTIADLFERDPENVSMILNRAGLPCISCSRSNSESLRDALAIHHIDVLSNSWILSELRSL